MSYSGDSAWKEWFDICSVSGCGPESSSALRSEIEGAMFARLAKYGISREDIGGDDPVAAFDAYFKLKGSREKGKPLKSYFAYRIEVERMRLKDFVCGTLFGSTSGRVHDIVADWIGCIKGWKSRWVESEDGKRRVVWESAPSEAEGPSVELSYDAPDVADNLDLGFIRGEIAAGIGRIAEKLKLEKRQVALLSYAVAMDVSITEPKILESLGVGKSRAYTLKDKVMSELGHVFSKSEIADDPAFGRLLIEVCEKMSEGGGEGEAGV